MSHCESTKILRAPRDLGSICLQSPKLWESGEYLNLTRRGSGTLWYARHRQKCGWRSLNVLLTQGTILVPQFVIAKMTLSFLGLGIPDPVPSWGNLLIALQQYSVLVSYWWMYLPALAYVPFFVGYQGLANALHVDRW
jgi:hypothetical protein